MLVSSLLAIASCCGPGKTENVAAEPPKSTEEQWGVQVQGIYLSAAGYMLDFRYRVVDPHKAADLFRRDIRPHLVDLATGAKLIVPSPPKVGPLRPTNPPQAGKAYFVMFANPGKLVKPGDKVTVVIGDFQARDIIVQ